MCRGFFSTQCAPTRVHLAVYVIREIIPVMLEFMIDEVSSPTFESGLFFTFYFSFFDIRTESEYHM